MSDLEMCARRAVFNGRGEANAAAKRLSPRRGKRLKAFCCAVCGHWHIGKEGHAAGSPGSQSAKRWCR